MLALVIAYSKMMLLFILIGTAVTLSRFGGRGGFLTIHHHDSGDPAR